MRSVEGISAVYSGEEVNKLDRPLDVTVDAVRNLLIEGYNRYNEAFRNGDPDQRYWDGYIRALHHVIELEDQ